MTWCVSRSCRCSLVIAAILGVIRPGPLAAQYNAGNPRFSKTYHHSRFDRTPPPAARPTRYRDDEDGGLARAVDAEEPFEMDEAQRRARQALMHNTNAHPAISPIPSGYRVQRARQTSGQERQALEAPQPEDLTAPSDLAPVPEPDQRFAEDPLPDSGMEYEYDERYFEGEDWQEGGGCWESDPCHGELCGFDRCCNWCESVFCQGNTSIGLGVVGFKSPTNRGLDGSFGFQEAVNFGTFVPFLPGSGIGWQVGARTIQSNIAGTSFAPEQRNQTFFTSGFFRRRRAGFNAGFVFDLLRDNWYSDINVGQVRAQFSWRFPQRHEWGYWFAAGDSVDTTISPTNPQQVDEWNPQELHAFFYRRRLCLHPCATMGLFAGFAGDGDGLIGANSNIPVTDNWAVQSSFVYLAPDESNADGGNEHEAWNVSLALVWTIGGHCEARYAPMFDVADNGSFILSRVTR